MLFADLVTSVLKLNIETTVWTSVRSVNGKKHEWNCRVSPFISLHHGSLPAAIGLNWPVSRKHDGCFVFVFPMFGSSLEWLGMAVRSEMSSVSERAIFTSICTQPTPVNVWVMFSLEQISSSIISHTVQPWVNKEVLWDFCSKYCLLAFSSVAYFLHQHVVDLWQKKSIKLDFRWEWCTQAV